MHKQLLIVMLICLRGIDYVSAQQWTKKDSVWLQNVLSGKEKLELNPETMKAIQSGSFINLDEPAHPQRFYRIYTSGFDQTQKSIKGSASRCLLVIHPSSRKIFTGL